jgi:hypothetical protein
MGGLARALHRAQATCVLWILVGSLSMLACGSAEPTGRAIVEADSPASRGSLLAEAISIETVGGQLAPILERDCPLPGSESVTFGTAEEGQGEILIYVYRGDATTTDAAVSLGTFEIGDLPRTNGDGVEVQVTFRADRDGVSMSVETGADGGMTLRRVDR